MKTRFKEFILTEKTSYDVIKGNQVPLTDEERKEAMDAKAVWHHGPGGKESCAIFKGKDSSGKMHYCSATHRAWGKSPNMKAAIKKFHDFVKTTA